VGEKRIRFASADLDEMGKGNVTQEASPPPLVIEGEDIKDREHKKRERKVKMRLLPHEAKKTVNCECQGKGGSNPEKITRSRRKETKKACS